MRFCSLTSSRHRDVHQTRCSKLRCVLVPCWPMPGSGRGQGTSPNAPPAPSGEGALDSEPHGSIPSWAAPGQNFTPLGLSFLTYETTAVGWSKLLSWQRATTFTLQGGLLSFHRGTQRRHMICPTSHSWVTPELPLWAQPALLC